MVLNWWLPTLSAVRNTVYTDQKRVEYSRIGKKIENGLICWLNVRGKTLDFQFLSYGCRETVRIFLSSF